MFSNIRNWSFKIFSGFELSWQSAFKRTKVISDLLTNNDMLIMVEKDIRREICQTISWYAKGNNKYMKD